MKEKKSLTPSQKKKRLSTIKTTLFAGEFLSVITPFVIIGAVNYNKYFVEYDGTKMSIACILAMAIMGIAVWLIASKKFTNSFITLIIGWATVDFIFYMLGQIIVDIATIMFFGLIGIIGAFGLDIAGNQVNKKLKSITESMKAAESEIVKEEYKEEIKENESKKKVKIRIKKSG